MKNRCAGLVVVLFLLFAFGVANADFDGVIDPQTTVTRIDSVELTLQHYPDMTFLTPGWGSHYPYDTFVFTGVAEWPATLTLYGTVNGIAAHPTINQPYPDTWYRVGFGVVTSYVMFTDHHPGDPGVVDGSKPTVERQQCLAVSPSLVTGLMTVKLQPASRGRPVVQIHDAVGNVVRSLGCTAGTDGVATATWNREDESGQLVPEGVYFCRYAASDVVAVRKVLVAH